MAGPRGKMPGGKKAKSSPSIRCKAAWIAQDNNCYLPSWKVDCSEKESGYIKDSCLFARIEKRYKIPSNDGDSVVDRSDSVYIHPDSMTLCGIGIATPTLIITANQTTSIVKPWPSRDLQLDQVGGSDAVMKSFDDEGCGLVCLSSLSVKASTVPVATLITLNHSEYNPAVLNKSFHNYLLVKNDGMLIINGSKLSICYHGQRYFFMVDTFSTGSIASSFDISSSSITCNASILSDSFHQLNISETPTQDTPNNSSIAYSTPIKPIVSPYSYPSSDIEHNGCGDIKNSVLESIAIGKINAKTTKIIFNDVNMQTIPSVRPSLASIGGLKKQIQLLQELVIIPLQSSEIVRSSGVQFPHGILLHGPSGTGKSLLAEAIAECVPSNYCNVFNAFDLLDDSSSNGGVNTVFDIVQSLDCNSAHIIVVNDIHYFVNESPQLRTLVKLLDFANNPTCSGHVVVIATTNQIEGVIGILRQQGRLDYEIEVPAPSSIERREILEVLLRDIPHNLTENDVSAVSSAAHGYVGMDLKIVCREAQYHAFRRMCGNRSHDHFQGGEEDVCSKHTIRESPKVFIDLDDLQKGLNVVKPSAVKEIIVEIPKVLWTDIGGEENIKTKLKESVEWPLKFPEAFTRLGVEAPKGILLYGPPGCSKTMIARALATESGLNFLSVKGPELFSKWVGDSERAVRQVFNRARAVAPSIIFFDEIDALATQRQGEGSKVGDRVLAQLLTEMDGLVSLKDVIIIAATNRPDILDKALLRPGRIDRLIYVSLPSPDTRREILKIQFVRSPVAEDVDIDELTQLTDMFSGAEIVALVQEAALNAMHEDIHSLTISRRHFMKAFEVVTPRTDLKTVEFYKQYNSN